ncbi:MAG: glycosyltransferase, partial [Myxococcota bacterium]
MKKPGFIFLFSTSTLTGQGAQSYALAVELMRRGHDVAIATDTRRGEGDFEAIARRDGGERLTSMALCTKAGPFSFVADVSRLKRIVRD